MLVLEGPPYCFKPWLVSRDGFSLLPPNQFPLSRPLFGSTLSIFACWHIFQPIARYVRLEPITACISNYIAVYAEDESCLLKFPFVRQAVNIWLFIIAGESFAWFYLICHEISPFEAFVSWLFLLL